MKCQQQPHGMSQLMGPCLMRIFVVLLRAPEHVIKPGNFGSWSHYRPISIHWSDTSIESTLHGLMLLIAMPPLMTFGWCTSASKLGWWYVLNINEPEYMCPFTARPSYLNNFILKRWSGCLTVWITNVRCLVLEMMHSIECAGIKTTLITIAPRHFMDYIYLLRLALISISHFFTFSLRVFLSLSLFT
jgi:hypothetical protein